MAGSQHQNESIDLFHNGPVVTTLAGIWLLSYWFTLYAGPEIDLIRGAVTLTRAEGYV